MGLLTGAGQWSERGAVIIVVVVAATAATASGGKAEPTVSPVTRGQRFARLAVDEPWWTYLGARLAPAVRGRTLHSTGRAFGD